MKKLLYFIGIIALTGFLLHWSRFELEYSVMKRGVFEQIQVLRRDKWKWEGSVTDLKYYECLPQAGWSMLEAIAR